MTFEEFRDAPWWKRLWYRIYRNPFFMFVLGPLFTFVLSQRFVGLNKGGRIRRSVLAVDAFIAGMAVLAIMLVLLLRGRIHKGDTIRLENGGLYWHLVDVVWIFILPLFYLAA